MGCILSISTTKNQVSRREGETDWVLGFKFVSERDEGMYECQVTDTSGRGFKKDSFASLFILGEDPQIRNGMQIGTLHPPVTKNN